MKLAAIALSICLSALAAAESIADKPFDQETAKIYRPGDGFPETGPDGSPYANFLAVQMDSRFPVCVAAVTQSGARVVLTWSSDGWSAESAPAQPKSDQTRALYRRAGWTTVPGGELPAQHVSFSRGANLYVAEGKLWEGDGEPRVTFAPSTPILSLAQSAKGEAAVGTEDALFVRPAGEAKFLPVFPEDERYRWAPRHVTALAYDLDDNLWFGAGQGIGVYNGHTWKLYTGAEGLPYDHFTGVAPGEKGVVWFGTERGAIRFDGKRFRYRANLRWLPDDYVNDIYVNGNVTWIATRGGVACISRNEMTLKEKADFYTQRTETHNNRDGYITDWQLTKRGDPDSAVPKITDNDGEYTAQYGTAMVFRYAATKDPEAKRLATRSFHALKALVDIVPESMKGFVARVLIPIDWHEPVNEQYGPKYNAQNREVDPFWKLITPRFVKSEDGKFLWKCDTSSDELSGHYFFYAVYYDLVCETEEERAPVRQVVRDITDHLLRNNYALVDHDGEPTRWGQYGPDFVDSIFGWDQRGLNSLMFLGMLAVAEHVTGDTKYGDEAKKLRDEHGYHINSMVSRPTFPPDNVVPWDNNMALALYYPLMHYETDPELLIMYRISLEHLWMFISREKNPYWGVPYAALCELFNERADAGFFKGAFPEAGPFTERTVKQYREYNPELNDVVDTLRGLPLDLIGWKMWNSHRLDVELDPTPGQEPAYGWSKMDRKALPIEERGHVRLDRGDFPLDAVEGDGWTLHEGTIFLLPYWMARYHGFFE